MKKLQHHEFQLAIQFSEELTNTDLWIDMAELLLAAAKLLEAEVIQYWSEVRVEAGQVVSTPSRKNVHGPYFLLTAYALENYFKALLVHKNRESFRNRLLTKIPNYIKAHDLLGLARKVSMKLTIVEEDLLSRLSRSSMWAARYPIPTGPTAITAIRLFSDGKTYLVAYFRPEDIGLVRAFVNRLREYVTKEIGISHNQALNQRG
ncbi:MAG: hypothetical protein NT096_11675 [Proteobacteria bacterium]|nr:hypothetical protein [Pseudomonadota bacterium]